MTGPRRKGVCRNAELDGSAGEKARCTLQRPSPALQATQVRAHQHSFYLNVEINVTAW